MLNVIGSDIFRHLSVRLSRVRWVHARPPLFRLFCVSFRLRSLPITTPGANVCGFSTENSMQRIFDKWTGMATGNYGNYSNDFEQKATKKRREKFSLASNKTINESKTQMCRYT